MERESQASEAVANPYLDSILATDLPLGIQPILVEASENFCLQSSELHPGFVLEAGAVMLISLWEQRGYLRHLDVQLPSGRDAATEFAVRAARGPSQFDEANSASLFLQVFKVHAENFAGDARPMLGSDVVLGDINEDELIDALAEFFWSHRNDLASSTNEASCELPPHSVPLFTPDYELLERYRSQPTKVN